MFVAEYICLYLEEIGISHVFGIPGYAVYPLYGFLSASNITPILARHEEGAAFMAYGYGLGGDKFAACVSTSGAASLHMLAGVAAAYANSVRMLVITGQIDTWKMGRCAFQEMSGRSPRSPNAMNMFAQTTIFSEEIGNTRDVPRILAAATDALQSPRPGPVHLSIPADILRSNAELPSWHFFTRAAEDFSQVRQDIIEQVSSMLATAQRPLLLIGRGCRTAIRELHSFIEAWQIPFCTTLQGRGLAAHESPWNLGVLGIMGSSEANDWVKKCDTLLVIGSSLNEFTTQGYTNMSRSDMTIIRVDQEVVSHDSHILSHIDVTTAARKILLQLTKHANTNHISCQSQDQPLVRKPTAHLRSSFSASAKPHLIAPLEVIDALEKTAPADAIFVADAGNNAAWLSHCLRLRDRQDFHIDINTGCLGGSIPASIGIKAAYPNRTVISVCGDGGMYMLGNEIASAVDAGIAPVWVVFNDRRLGMVHMALTEGYGVSPSTEYKNVDLTTWARGLGVSVVTIYSASHLKEMLHEVFFDPKDTTPILLDVHVNQEHLPQFFPRAKRSHDQEEIYQEVQQAIKRKDQRKDESESFF